MLASSLCVFLFVQCTSYHLRIRDVSEAAGDYFGEALGNFFWLKDNAKNFYISTLTGIEY